MKFLIFMCVLLVAGCATTSGSGGGLPGGTPGGLPDPSLPGGTGASLPSPVPSLPSGSTLPGSSGGASTSSGGSSGSSGSTPAQTTGQGGSSGQGPDVTASAQTDAERRAAIDRKMDESLGTFDASIRKERERIARDRDARASGSGSGAGPEVGSGDSGAGSGGKEGDLKSGVSAGEVSQTGGDLKSEGKTAAAGSAGTGSAGSGSGKEGRDIPDGRDDDIIARQIREAAEKETDPELKEKLWKEYADYKKNVQKK